MQVEDIEVYEIKLYDLIDLAGDPFEIPIWTIKPVSKDYVRKCYLHSKLDSRPSKDGLPGHAPEDYVSKREYHSRRIAYLMWHRDTKPVILDTTTHSLDIVDGWHRIAAALMLKDEWITVSFDGYEQNFFDMFGNNLRKITIQID